MKALESNGKATYILETYGTFEEIYLYSYNTYIGSARRFIDSLDNKPKCYISTETPYADLHKTYSKTTKKHFNDFVNYVSNRWGVEFTPYSALYGIDKYTLIVEGSYYV